MSRRGLALALAVAAALRLAAILSSDRVVADVKRYERVANHLLDVSWNPYETKRLYPYPPPWAGFEAGAGWLARRGVLSFPVAIKLPVLAAELAIVALLAAMARAGRASPLAPWLYALHPVAILVGGFHGQFDALALACVLLAIEALARGRRDASALALAAAIALKSFPVLLLPFLAPRARGWPAALRYAALALAPVALLLLPFAIADPVALRRELFGYSGIADFGWTGALRGTLWVLGEGLARGEASAWPLAALVSKALFLSAWLGLVLLAALGRLRFTPAQGCLAVVLAFLGLYGLLSAQYLLWAVPLGLLWPVRHAGAYALAATLALAGFYLFLAPGVLLPVAPGAAPPFAAGHAWAAGVVATLAASLSWLYASVREARRAATDAS